MYCCGQPTAAALETTLNKVTTGNNHTIFSLVINSIIISDILLPLFQFHNQVCGEIYPKDKKIIWFNMRWGKNMP